MRIVITGSPGTGKSATSRELSRRLCIEIIDLKRVAREKGLVGKNHEVDVSRLSQALRPILRGKKDFIAEGHLACEIPLPADFVIVLRTNPATLRRRLMKRGYGRKKLEENLMAEMLDYCVQRAERAYRHSPLELDTSGRSVQSCASEIIKAIRLKKRKIDKVDFSPDLETHLKVRKGR